jgi:hypothetical protein
MDPPIAFSVKQLSAATTSLVALLTVALLISSGTTTEETLAASGLLTDFLGAGEEVQINFTSVGGSENTSLSLLLPKQSNVVDARLNFTGDDIFIDNQKRTYKSAYDFRAGQMDNLMFDTTGLHLDMDTMAPFWPYFQKSTGNNPVDIATGDFNSDRRPDLVVANYDADSITVWYQNAQGKLATKTTHQTSDQPNTVDKGDFNKDGMMDIAVGCYGGKNINFFYQKSGGGFTTGSYSIGVAVEGIATGDLNKDGRDDLAVAGNGKYIYTVLQSTSGWSTGQSTKAGEDGSWYTAHDVHDVAVADFNSDGRDDVVVATSGSYTYQDYYYYGKIKWYYQTTSGTLTYQDFSYGWTGAYNIVAGDVSGDGRPDVVWSQKSVKNMKVLYQPSNGNWPSSSTSATKLSGDQRVHRLEIADVDSDGKLDVLGATEKPSLIFYKQSGGKLSTTAKKFPLPASAVGRAVAVADFDMDGHADAAVASGPADSISIFKQRLEYDRILRFRGDPATPPCEERQLHLQSDQERRCHRVLLLHRRRVQLDGHHQQNHLRPGQQDKHPVVQDHLPLR